MIALFPGSFDPVTKAHADVYWQANRAFGYVVPVIASNPGKDKGLLSPSFRQEAWRSILGKTEPEPVIAPAGASIVDLAHQLGARTIVRGLRGPEDFAAERAYREFIARNGPGIDVAYFFTSSCCSDISSSAVRQILTLEGSDRMLTGYLDTAVIGYLRSLSLTK